MSDAKFNEMMHDLEQDVRTACAHMWQCAHNQTSTKIELADPEANLRSFSVSVGGRKMILVRVEDYPYER